MGKVIATERAKERKEEEAVLESNDKFDEVTLSFFRREHGLNIVEEFKALKDIGEISSDQITDRMVLTREINRSAGCARRANLIFLKARKERELFRLTYLRAMRELTRKATEQVEIWLKANNITKKQITKDMVEQEMASDEGLRKEYTELLEKQEMLRNIREDCELLAHEWSERKRTLQTQARLITAEKENIFGSRARHDLSEKNEEEVFDE